MFTKYVLPLLAIAGLTFAVVQVREMRRPAPPSQPIVTPPTAPEKVRSIAGAGIVEAKRENIPIGTPVPGVVDAVYVKIHDVVKAGQPLFHVDDRDLRAELVAREASVTAARAQLDRLRRAPRAEDIPPAEAALAEAQARLLDARAAFRRSKSLREREMLAAADYDRDNYAEKAAEAALARADADLKKIKAGSWIEDIKVAEASLKQAEAQVASMKIMIDRLTVRALVDGEILQVHVRPGQFAALNWNEPLVVLGDVRTLHVRIDIDENDLPWFAPGAEAVATLKGRPAVKYPLEFVKFEPYVIPKRSLTGDNSERVDTRVLQAIYAIKDFPTPVYVGQQMDVYLRAGGTGAVSFDANASQPRPFEEAPTPVAKLEKGPAS
ncbi:MAG TPA: HlyD family efflux transporter periplasmic adaptor subunit [Isosphaeraceae bacterium]